MIDVIDWLNDFILFLFTTTNTIIIIITIIVSVLGKK